MSLINQMLRDLESRNTSTNAPSTLQHNVQITQRAASKMPLLVWSLLAIITTGGTYWAYQYSKTLVKTSPVIVVNNIKKEPIPVTPFEKVLAASNAVTSTPAPKTEQKPPENNTPTSSVIETQPIIAAAKAVQPVQPAPVVQPISTPGTITALPKAAPTPAAQAVPEIATAPPVNNRPINPNPLPTHKITAKQQADILYRQAENNSEDSLATIYKLEQALNLDPRHLRARLLLAKTLHNQGKIQKTAEFLDQSLALFPDNLQFINTRAQLFLQQKDPNGALNTLQRIDLTNTSNETYLSLLAATYHQLQSFANAAKVYQKLVTVNPGKAENWLGLALAQEKLGNPKLAREFYQQALGKNSLKEPVANYIKQRLAELR